MGVPIHLKSKANLIGIAIAAGAHPARTLGL
jgi:hypothetical protein